MEYKIRINKALNHINEHLSQGINVSDLAKISGFSLYHFHRIYKGIMNETPYDTLLRLRLEKAIFHLRHNKASAISSIAYECGFSSPENFSRQFKARFKVSPSKYRNDKDLQNSRIYQEPQENDFYLRIEDSRNQHSKEFDVTIEYLEDIPIAYIKAVFGADGSGLVEQYMKLITWADSNNISYQGPLRRFGMSIDNPEVTPASKYRYDFAVRREAKHSEDGEVEFGVIPKTNYASIHVNGKLEDVAQAWDFLYQKWLPNNEYLPLHYPAIEEFIQGPEEIGWENFNLKCRVPIVKI